MAQAAPFLIAGSTLLSAKSTLDQGDQAEKDAEREAAQIREQGVQEFAKGTRESYEEARQGKILAENARAAQAASGGTTTDAGAISDMAAIQRDTEYNSLAALFEGKSRRQELLKRAKVREDEGRIAKKASRTAALSTILSGGSKAFSAYKAGQ